MSACKHECPCVFAVMHVGQFCQCTITAGVTLCSRPYVLPDKYVLKLTDADLGVESPKGILLVHLLGATNVWLDVF